MYPPFDYYHLMVIWTEISYKISFDLMGHMTEFPPDYTGILYAYNCREPVGTASVSFARGQHLTRSGTPWRALPTTLSHEARPTHSFTCNSTRGLGGRPVLAPLSSSHEAAAAFDIPSPSWDPSETVHSEVEVIINKASRTIIESISSYLCTVAQTGVRIGKELRPELPRPIIAPAMADPERLWLTQGWNLS